MTGFELDALELGERVALELDGGASCGCRWRKKFSGRTRWAPCADHAPEPQDWTHVAVIQPRQSGKTEALKRIVRDGSPLLTVNGQPVAWYENWIRASLQRSLDRRG